MKYPTSIGLAVILLFCQKLHQISPNKHWNSLVSRFGECERYISHIPDASCLESKSIISGSTSNIFLIKHDNQVRILKVQRSVRRSKIELEYLLKFENIPGVIKLFHYREISHYMLLVLQFGSRGTLEHLILNDSKFADQSLVIDVLGKLVDIVSRVHSMSVVHCDVNPRNIVFDEHYNPILIDFNISRDMLVEGRVKGRAEFKAPEIYDLDKALFRPELDVYSLGVTLYFMLYKHYPFSKNAFGRLTFSDVYLSPPLSEFFVQIFPKMLTRKEHRINLDKIRESIQEFKANKMSSGSFKMTSKFYKFGYDSGQLIPVGKVEYWMFLVRHIFFSNFTLSISLIFGLFTIFFVFIWKINN